MPESVRAQETPKYIKKNRNTSCPHGADSSLFLYFLSTKPIPLFWYNFDLLTTMIIMSGIKSIYSAFFCSSRIDVGHPFAIFSQIGIFHINPWSFLFLFFLVASECAGVFLSLASIYIGSDTNSVFVAFYFEKSENDMLGHG